MRVCVCVCMYVCVCVCACSQASLERQGTRTPGHAEVDAAVRALHGKELKRTQKENPLWGRACRGRVNVHRTVSTKGDVLSITTADHALVFEISYRKVPEQRALALPGYWNPLLTEGHALTR